MKKLSSIGKSIIRLFAITAIVVVSAAFIYEYNNPGVARENFEEDQESVYSADYHDPSYAYTDYDEVNDPYASPGMANDFSDRTDDTSNYADDYYYGDDSTYDYPSYDLSSNQGEVYVEGYTRSDGTQVSGHYRTAPNATTSDNWSSMGNINPHTGRIGTK